MTVYTCTYRESIELDKLLFFTKNTSLCPSKYVELYCIFLLTVALQGSVQTYHHSLITPPWTEHCPDVRSE
jgi:hypothetical protein